MSTKTEPTPPAPTTAQPNTSRRGWFVGLALVVLAVLGGAFWWSREHQATHSSHGHATAGARETASEPAQSVRVEVIHPQRGGIPRTSTQNGSVYADEWADLFAKVSGFLKEQKVDYGSRVKKGDLLDVIDDPEIVKEADPAAAALSQARAAVATAKALIVASEANREASAAEVKQSEAEVERYTATRKYREKVLARYKDLYSRSAVDLAIVEEEEQYLDSARANEHAAIVAVQTAKAKHLKAAAEVDKSRADLAEAEANVEVAKAVLAKAKVLVDYTEIRAPFDGVITHRTFFPGAFIRSAAEGNMTSLLTIARTDKVRVVTYIPDRDVPYTDIGDEAEIRLDALPGEVFKGKVSRFSETEDPQSRTMHTEIDLDNPNGRLREGMYGTATIILEKVTKSLTVPVSAVAGRSEDKPYVFVVREGQARKTPVTLGTDDGIRIEIRSGLNPDDLVILNGHSVSDGSPVVTEPSQAASADHGLEIVNGHSVSDGSPVVTEPSQVASADRGSH